MYYLYGKINRGHSICPLYGGRPLFGESAIRGFTVFPFKWWNVRVYFGAKKNYSDDHIMVKLEPQFILVEVLYAVCLDL